MVEELGISKDDAPNFCLQVHRELSYFILFHIVRFWAVKNTWWRITPYAPSPVCWTTLWLMDKPILCSDTRTTFLLRFASHEGF